MVRRGWITAVSHPHPTTSRIAHRMKDLILENIGFKHPRKVSDYLKRFHRKLQKDHLDLLQRKTYI